MTTGRRTAPGTHAGAFALAAVAFVLTLGCSGSPATAQVAGDATFRVYLRSSDIGSASSSLTRDIAGWTITGGGALGEPYMLTLRQLEIHFTADWKPQRMTMEQADPMDSAVVHVAFGLADGTTRTDVVRPGQAVWGANKVAEDTIPLPDFVFAAYEVLAARLIGAAPGAEFRVFVVPRFEAILHVDSVDDQTLRTTTGTIPVKRWRTTLQRPEGPTPIHVWVNELGRLYRLDFPKEEIMVIREDVLERPQ